jgi:predicted Rossmann-fold nucleotide-binding protein
VVAKAVSESPHSAPQRAPTVSLADEEGVKRILVAHGTFFTRLHHFVLMSDAYVVAPGGIGTVLESVMIWQLLQVRHPRHAAQLRGPMWKGLVEWASAQMLQQGFELASPQDMQIPTCVDGADQAMGVIRGHHARWTARRSHGEM